MSSSACQRHLYWRDIFCIPNVGFTITEVPLSTLEDGIILEVQRFLKIIYEDEKDRFETELWHLKDQISVIDARCYEKLNLLNTEFDELVKIIDQNAMKSHKTDDGVFKGQFDADGKNSGFGMMLYSDKSVYNGQWKGNKKHGYGKFNYKSGGFYEGQWVDDKKHGCGRYTFSNGNVYEGDWTDGKINGKGMFKYKSGNLYGGDWKNGEMHGKGI